MGVDYEEYFGCDETGESVEDALEREMLLADDDEPDIDTIEEENDIEARQAEEARYSTFKKRLYETFELEHVRAEDMEFLARVLYMIIRAFPPGYTTSYTAGPKDKLCTIDHSNVYSLLSACFASEDTAVRAHTYLQAIAEHARAIENEERGLGNPDEEIPF